MDAAGYFGPAKFTPQVDAARVESARRAARDPAAPTGSVEAVATATAFTVAWRATDAAVQAQPTDRVVRTRHGDPMTVHEFLVTRVVEVGVHGLDLAVALHREPWLTPAAAQVIADLFTGDDRSRKGSAGTASPWSARPPAGPRSLPGSSRSSRHTPGPPCPSPARVAPPIERRIDTTFRPTTNGQPPSPRAAPPPSPVIKKFVSC